ncbi:PEP-CTERM sorting domain-containing protein [Roseibacillus persicicus]|uniref:PEP-CTERM sorting domain-containing protein n=1 Tax=Roseibacillus persicicus TaxID=454148 RepID=UPI00280EC710|nr:PEP-CTERM sorting domain-containing protein [Roseibacillus persicicus]MDQ8189265.1 PEP-CTERM sorting domain-containing protein [Roseibacillus persicicus]
MNSKTTISLLSILGAGTGFGALSVGTLINIDYHNGNGVHSGAGVVGGAGDTWNYVNNPATGSSGTLLTHSGASTAIQNYSDGVLGGGRGSHSWGTDTLAQDYHYLRDNSTGTIALPNGTFAGVGRRMTIYDQGASTDLDSSQTWNLHLIAAGDNGLQGANFLLKQSDGAGGFVYLSLANSGGPAYSGTLDEGVHYGTFENVVPTTWGGSNHEFEIYWYWTDPDTNIIEDPLNPGVFIQDSSPGGGNSFTGFNGVQLELIPEPSSALLLFVGLGFSLRRKR